MLRFQDLVELISKRRTPKPSKGFWNKFDGELSRKLDKIDASRLGRRNVFADKIRDMASIFTQPQFRYALVVTCVVLILCTTMFSLNSYQPAIYSVASLSGDGLVEELLYIENISSPDNGIDIYYVPS